MKTLGLSISALARELHVPPNRVHAIVHGQRAALLTQSGAPNARARERAHGSEAAGSVASFDAVVAVNSVFYAANMAAAMRELVRVVRRGGRVVVTAWGPPEKREFLRAVMPALGPLMPPPPPGATPRIQGRCLNRERWRAFSKRQACASWRRARSPVPLSSQAPRHRGAETPALGSTKTQFTRLSCALYHGDCGGPIGKPTPIPDPITLTKYLE